MCSIYRETCNTAIEQFWQDDYCEELAKARGRLKCSQYPTILRGGEGVHCLHRRGGGLESRDV